MKKNGRNLKSPPVQSNHMINQNNPSKLKKSEV